MVTVSAGAIIVEAVQGRTFTGDVIELGYVRFEDCTFRECRFVYRGDPAVDFVRCIFQQCDWIFDGPAEHTLVFLSKVYRGFGVDGQHLLGAIVQSIKDGTVGQADAAHQYARAAGE